MRSALIMFVVLSTLFSCAPSGDINDYSTYFYSKEDQTKDKEVSVTFFGVSTLLFDDGETQLFVDGFFSRPSARKVVFSKLATDEDLLKNIIAEYDLTKLKAVVTTHSHYDHALDAAILAKLTSAKLFGSISTLNLGRGENLPDSLLIEFAPNVPISVGDFKITVITGKHSPPKILNADLGEVINEPLVQPAKYYKWKEGGSYDFLIERGDLSFYVKPSPNYVEGALDSIRSDVLFLGTGSIGDQNDLFKQNFYDQTAGKLKPSLLVPIHWDNFLKKDYKNLQMMPYYMDRGKRTFDYLIKRTDEDNIDFKILLGGETMTFFQ
jgi:L-ascorbate metabolism protein UlaG (beta-lactamase superfamily)